MDRNTKAHDTIELLASELDEVDWFGRESIESAPSRVGPLDQLLFLMGGSLDEDELRKAS